MARHPHAGIKSQTQQPSRESKGKPGPVPPERKAGENMQRNKHDRDRQGQANDLDPENSPAAGEVAS